MCSRWLNNDTFKIVHKVVVMGWRFLRSGARLCIPGFHTTTHLAKTAYYLPWGSAQEALVNTRGSKTILCEGNYNLLTTEHKHLSYTKCNYVSDVWKTKRRAEPLNSGKGTAAEPDQRILGTFGVTSSPVHCDWWNSSGVDSNGQQSLTLRIDGGSNILSWTRLDKLSQSSPTSSLEPYSSFRNRGWISSWLHLASRWTSKWPMRCTILAKCSRK